MRIFEHIAREDGYTLLETVVAMALFLSVLIPLAAVVGNLMIDGTPDQFSLALRMAEGEMSSTMVERSFTGDTIKTSAGWLVEKEVQRQGYLKNVRIAVSKSNKHEKKVVMFSKTFLDYE